VITDLAQFSQQVDLDTIELTSQGIKEIWLAVDPAEQEAFITQLEESGLEESITGNSLEQLEIFRNNLVYQVVATAFELNAVVLIPLSVVGFSLIQLFSIQRRADEFNVLQAMGLSKSQLRSLLIREGVIFVSLGLLLGIGIGYGLAIMMQPFLAQILPVLSGNLVLNQILVNWSEVGIRFLILIGCYGIGLFILMLGAIRQQRKAPF
jgi:ABC-type antimicrobial peptide transport system permease subunit